MNLKLLICFAFLLKTVVCHKKSKTVTTLLEAKWGSTPLVMETVEYLADENLEFYWNFIDSISNLKVPLDNLGNDKIKYDVIIDHASKLLTPSQLNVLKLGLSLHIFSPKVEMFSQMAIERNLPKCPAVADVGGELICDINDVKTAIKNYPKDKNNSVEIFKVDNHFPGSQNRSLVVVLYAELGSSDFAKFHTVLKNEAQEGSIDYVIRHWIKAEREQRLRLSGFGVELQMKSTEYKVQDDAEIHDNPSSSEGVSEEEESELEGFDFFKLKSLYPDLKQDLDKFKQHLEETSSEMAPLKVWQFQELSLQAAERIMTAPKEEMLKVFINTAQNFPMQAKGLVKTVVNEKLKWEIVRNQENFAATLNLQPSDTALFINGLYYDADLVDVYEILDVVRQELRTMEGLHSLGLGNKMMNEFLSLDFGENSGGQEFAMDIRDSAINWINDIETDSRYSNWPSSYIELLKPTFPGMLRKVRRNLFNLVIIIDPTNKEVRNILKLMESFVIHMVPLRIGLVLSVSSSSQLTGLDDAGVAMSCAFNYVSQKKDATAALSFLSATLASAKESKVTVAEVKEQITKKFNDDPNDILGEDSDYDFGRKLTEDFVKRAGLTSVPQALMNGIPLPSAQLNIDDFEEAVLTEVMSQMPSFQKAVLRGKLEDRDDVFEYIMNQPNVMPRLNERILGKDYINYLDMTGTAASSMKMAELIQLSPRDMTATALQNLRYFTSSKKARSFYGMTYWIIGDLNCKKSQELLLAALKHMKSNGDIRVAFLPNVDGVQDNKLNKAVLAALVLPPERGVEFVINLLTTGNLNEMPTEVKSIIESQELNLKMLRIYAQRVLNFKASQRGVIANSRILGPFDDEEAFTMEDFSLLDQFSAASYGDKIKKSFEQNRDDYNADISSDALMKIISLLVSRPQTKSRFNISSDHDKYSVIKLPAADPEKAAFDLVAVVDPVSRGAQKLGPILQVLQEVLNCNIRIFLNSVEKNSDMPLKSFYRFVLESEIQFNENGVQMPGPIAKFTNMPQSPLLTQNMHVPDNWLVEVVRSVYDLDNIRLENVDNNVHSEYELEHLLLEGHCFEESTLSPPRGLQITLGTENKPVIVDTIVMANLGYFQLKANPGAWILRLRQGRSADIYNIVSHDGSDTPTNSEDIKVVINSLRSHIVKLKVAKKPDKIGFDLLSENDGNSGIWNSITSSFTGSEEDTETKLNIFSLASGHLYERFLRIMMLSVLKNTKTPVKFWFLKNYLSPQIKDFLPYMAKEYNFEYELVQYKWPRWLHQQTEKQRIIWGYKILFLDVLFPLDVKKIIFVDADQVVRADMRDLQQFDLGGAPYGYTPFCESRKEMDGFRFWKQGYWRNHLQGRRYHISALYVVDLKRFRRIAAGDRLRGQYQALSQDPNSLSNLDQDLPNNMIHQVAIKSLPQEWMWCETWCDDESKKYAKTIDLCNNPMTKEAKLTAAMRILPEWKGYDEEIRKLQQKIDLGVLDHDPAEEVEGRNNVRIEL